MAKFRGAVLALSIMSTFALRGCTNKGSPKSSPVSSLSTALFQCSPLSNFDETQEIILRNDGNIVVIGDGEVKVNAQSPESWAKWEPRGADSVALNLTGEWADYTLYRPLGDEHCILSQGPIRSVDLQSSWFGTPDFSDDGERPDSYAQ